jgi:hypothetical protein
MSSSTVEINDLIAHTNALHFTDPSLPILDVPSDTLPQPPSFILVGKLISTKPVAKSVIKSNILQAWQFLKSLVTEDKEDNKMVFIFEDLEDLNRVLQNSPWNIKPRIGGSVQSQPIPALHVHYTPHQKTDQTLRVQIRRDHRRPSFHAPKRAPRRICPFANALHALPRASMVIHALPRPGRSSHAPALSGSTSHVLPRALEPSGA